MSAWDSYVSLTEIRGKTKRGSALRRTAERLSRRIPDTLSYQEAVIYGRETGFRYTDGDALSGSTKNVAIINSDNLNEKTILSLPGDDIEHGSLVAWMGNHWLVTERDANTTLYTKAKMIQCNHLLHWMNEDGKVCEQWCVIEDGTKYLTGELEDRNFVVTRGDSRISMMIARNAETVRLNREHRFLIDDPESPIKLAYQLTKPLKLGWSFNDEGVYKFVLQEVTSTSNDDVANGVADYYKYYSRDDGSQIEPVPEQTDPNGKKVWL